MKFISPLRLHFLAKYVYGVRIPSRSVQKFKTPEDEEQHSKSMREYGKAGYDFQYLFDLEKHQLAYKVIRLQRQVDSYITMKSLRNVDGRDKVRVAHPDPENIIDHYDYNRRRIAFKVAYLGWDYMAYYWSYTLSDRAVKGHTNVIERVFLEALVRQQIIQNVDRRTNLERCGRTDQGVSGLSQVICLNVRTNMKEGYGVSKRLSKEEYLEKKKEQRRMREIEEEGGNELKEGEIPEKGKELTENGEIKELGVKTFKKYVEDPRFSVHDREEDSSEIPYVQLLNEALPPDIRVLAWSPVSRDFSPRSSCLNRTYRYYFPRGDLDIDLMNEASKKLVGKHDFRYFGKYSVDNMHRTTERVMKSIEIEVLPNRTDPGLPEFDICVATISASAFIYRQIRLMMTVLYSIGKGFQDPSIIDELLDVDETKGRPAYNSFDGSSLILYDTEYDDEEVDWRWDQDALLNTSQIMAELWNEKAMKSEILRGIYSNVVDHITDKERREVAKGFAIDNMRASEGEDLKDIQMMERSKSQEDFKEMSRIKSIRRLQRKGRYTEASKLHKSGESVKWKIF